jgi:hypothetical protein
VSWHDRAIHVLLGDRPGKVPADEAARYYAQSYLAMRTAVGVLGILLPAVFILGEMFFLKSGFLVRGSISAYYHTQMQDVFVAGLGVIGFLLITYMGAHPTTRDFWYSLMGGAFLLGVVFFPTWRSVRDGALPCGDPTFPPGCSPVEQRLGEALTAHVHQGCAIGFILSLALMSFLFARDERVVHGNRLMQRWQFAFGVLILIAGIWAVFGPTILAVTGLYVGEVAAVWMFAASWLCKGLNVRDLVWQARLRPPPQGEPAGPAPAPAPEPGPEEELVRT